MARGLSFRLIACDWQTHLAEVDTFESATVIARFNDVSTWELVLPSDTPAAQALLSALRPRLLILDQTGTVFRSGPVLRSQRNSSIEGEMLTLSGVDDLIWLRRRLAHPQPGSAAPPYSSSATDSRTGAASQVIAGYVDRNAGPSAVAARQVPGLLVPPPAAFGATVAISARYENLLELLQPAARAAGIGFRVRDLSFEVFQPSGVAVFSTDLGTLAGWEAVAEAPDNNYVYVGGGGEGTARLIREYTDTPSVQAWGRIETFRDRRDTTTTAEMDQSGAEALAEGSKPPTVAMESIDTTSQSFLRDWNVGDRATVRVGAVTITDVIAEALLELRANEPPEVRPVLGGAAINLPVWRSLALANRRLRQLERT